MARMGASLTPTRIAKTPMFHDKRPGPKALLVDDVVVTVRLTLHSLHRAGYEADTAANGRVAVELAKKSQYDVILMDVKLPVMNGVEATKLIRQHEKEHNLKPALIFGLTGLVSKDDLANYQLCGMDGCIEKGSIIVEAVRYGTYEKKSNPAFLFISSAMCPTLSTIQEIPFHPSHSSSSPVGIAGRRIGHRFGDYRSPTEEDLRKSDLIFSVNPRKRNSPSASNSFSYSPFSTASASSPNLRTRRTSFSPPSASSNTPTPTVGTTTTATQPTPAHLPATTSSPRTTPRSSPLQMSRKLLTAALQHQQVERVNFMLEKEPSTLPNSSSGGSGTSSPNSSNFSEVFLFARNRSLSGQEGRGSPLSSSRSLSSGSGEKASSSIPSARTSSSRSNTSTNSTTSTSTPTTTTMATPTTANSSITTIESEPIS